MTSSADGSMSFKPITEETKIETPLDLVQLFFLPEGEDEYQNVILADSKLFQSWISKYITVNFEPGSTELWSYDERFQVIRKCIEKNNMLSGHAIYVKEATASVGTD